MTRFLSCWSWFPSADRHHPRQALGHPPLCSTRLDLCVHCHLQNCRPEWVYVVGSKKGWLAKQRFVRHADEVVQPDVLFEQPIGTARLQLQVGRITVEV